MSALFIHVLWVCVFVHVLIDVPLRVNCWTANYFCVGEGGGGRCVKVQLYITWFFIGRHFFNFSQKICTPKRLILTSHPKPTKFRPEFWANYWLELVRRMYTHYVLIIIYVQRFWKIPYYGEFYFCCKHALLWLVRSLWLIKYRPSAKFCLKKLIFYCILNIKHFSRNHFVHIHSILYRFSDIRVHVIFHTSEGKVHEYKNVSFMLWISCCINVHALHV